MTKREEGTVAESTSTQELDEGAGAKPEAEAEANVSELAKLLRAVGIRLARVVMLAGSEPAFGSVSPKQPIHSPVASFGRYFCFCASVPNALIGTITSDDCTDIIER